MKTPKEDALSIYNKEVFFSEESIPEENFKKFSKKDHERISFMRELITELWAQNPNLSLKDMTDAMRKPGLDPNLIDAVLKENHISHSVSTTKQKLIKFFLAQNPHFSKETIEKHWNK